MYKARYSIGLLGVISLILFGFEMCLIEEIWIRVIVGIVDILAFLMNIEPVSKKEVDGLLYIVPGEDSEHVALGLSINTTPDQLFVKQTATLEIVNRMGGNTNGINKE